MAKSNGCKVTRRFLEHLLPPLFGLLFFTPATAQTPNDAVDDTEWLQSYINDLRKPTTVDRKPLESGKYLVSDTLKVGTSMGLQIAGAGGHDRSQSPLWNRFKACTILEWTGGEKPMIELSGCSGLVLEGLNLQDPDRKATHGLLFTHGGGALNIAIRDCGFIGQQVAIQWGTAQGESTCANCTYDNCYFEANSQASVRIMNSQSLEHLFIRPKWAFTPKCIDVQAGGRVTVIGGGPFNCDSLLHLGKVGGNSRGYHLMDVRFDGKNLRQAWLTVDDTDRARGYGTITFSNCSQNDGQSGDTTTPLVTVPPGARVVLRDCSFSGSQDNWIDVYARANVQGELSVQDCDGISASDFQALVEAKAANAYYEFIRCGAIWGQRGSYSTFPDAKEEPSERPTPTREVEPSQPFTPEEVAKIKRMLAGDLVAQGELRVVLPDGE